MPENRNGDAKPQVTVAEQRLKNLKPFKKGDPRINRSGRPKSFDQFRHLAQEIACEGGNAEKILRRWYSSAEPSLQKAFIEYAFGKVPDKIEATGLENKTTLVLHFDHENGVTRQ